MSKIDMEALSDAAKALAGTWFGNMRVNGDSNLTMHLIENKPTERTKAALDELVAAEVISEQPVNHLGGLLYRPLVDCHDAFVWSAKLLLDGKGDHINWQLMEPVTL